MTAVNEADQMVSTALDRAAAGAQQRARLEQLGERIAQLSAQISAATYELLVMLREFDEQGGWNSGFLSCAHWLCWRVGLDVGAAREKLRVARALGALPQLAAAMRRGELSYSKVRALTRIATPANEECLLTFGRAGTAAHVERLVRGMRRVDRLAAGEDERRRHASRYLRAYTDQDGMVVVTGRLAPEAGAALLRALDAGVEKLYGPRTKLPACAARAGAETPHTPRTSSPAGTVRAGGDALDQPCTSQAFFASRTGAEALPAPHTRVPSGAACADAETLNRAPTSQASGAEQAGGAALPGPHTGQVSDYGAAADDTDDTSPEQRRADALGLVAESALAAGLDPGSRGDRYQVVVHVDAEALPAGGAGESWLQDGTHVSAETCRRLACDSAQVVMRHAADGTVLDVGRRTRAISPALRRALEHRDGGCRFPGCARRVCDAHHVQAWADGGATNLANTVLLCRRHHRAVHEEGFSMRLAPDGTARFDRPDGRPLPQAPTLPAAAEEPIAALAAHLARHDVVVDTGATLPDWWGDPVDYAWAIDWLLYLAAGTSASIAS
jgi:Domain of unknown function (DUF222)/HNH endonuclease